MCAVNDSVVRIYSHNSGSRWFLSGCFGSVTTRSVSFSGRVPNRLLPWSMGLRRAPQLRFWSMTYLLLKRGYSFINDRSAKEENLSWLRPRHLVRVSMSLWERSSAPGTWLEESERSGYIGRLRPWMIVRIRWVLLDALDDSLDLKFVSRRGFLVVPSCFWL